MKYDKNIFVLTNLRNTSKFQNYVFTKYEINKYGGRWFGPWPIINSIWILLGNFTHMSIWTHLLITYLQVKFPLQSKYILSHIDIIFHVVKGGYSSLSWNFQSIKFNWQMNFLLYLNFVRSSVGHFNVILSFFVQSIQL